MAGPSWSQYVDAAFDQLDKDGSGQINMEEILDLLPESYARSSCEDMMLEARSLMREADVDGDGCISRSDFAKLMSKSSYVDALVQYDARITAEMDVGR